MTFQVIIVVVFNLWFHFVVDMLPVLLLVMTLWLFLDGCTTLFETRGRLVRVGVCGTLVLLQSFNVSSATSGCRVSVGEGGSNTM